MNCVIEHEQTPYLQDVRFHKIPKPLRRELTQGQGTDWTVIVRVLASSGIAAIFVALAETFSKHPCIMLLYCLRSSCPEDQWTKLNQSNRYNKYQNIHNWSLYIQYVCIDDEYRWMDLSIHPAIPRNDDSGEFSCAHPLDGGHGGSCLHGCLSTCGGTHGQRLVHEQLFCWCLVEICWDRFRFLFNVCWNHTMPISWTKPHPYQYVFACFCKTQLGSRLGAQGWGEEDDEVDRDSGLQSPDVSLATCSTVANHDRQVLCAGWDLVLKYLSLHSTTEKWLTSHHYKWRQAKNEKLMQIKVDRLPAHSPRRLPQQLRLTLLVHLWQHRNHPRGQSR